MDEESKIEQILNLDPLEVEGFVKPDYARGYNRFRRIVRDILSHDLPDTADDERAALAKFIRDSASYNLAVVLSEGEADFLAGEFLRFREEKVDE